MVMPFFYLKKKTLRFQSLRANEIHTLAFIYQKESEMLLIAQITPKEGRAYK